MSACCSCTTSPTVCKHKQCTVVSLGYVNELSVTIASECDLLLNSCMVENISFVTVLLRYRIH